MLSTALQRVIFNTWSPRTLLRGRTGEWWTASDMGTLFQDRDGTTAVTAANDVVGRWVGKVNGTVLSQTTDTASLKPLYRSGGYVHGDGVDDFLEALSLSITGYPMTIGLVYDGTSVVSGGIGVASVCVSDAEFRAIGVNDTAGAASDRGTTINSSTSPLLSKPVGATSRQSAFAVWTDTGLTFLFQEGTTGTLATTNPHTLAAKFIFGRNRDGSPVRSNARVAELLVVNAELSAGDRARLRAYWGAA